jgi:hypothetical protein
MSYRPITDVWILGRPKVKYHGAYPSGFLERARIMLGCMLHEPIMHVCGGKAKEYNRKPAPGKSGITLTGYGVNDFTVDLDPEVKPDVLFDVRAMFRVDIMAGKESIRFPGTVGQRIQMRPRGAIIDRPYTLEDADKYACGKEVMPKLNLLLADTLKLVVPGGIVGVLDYKWPRCQDAKNLALISVNCGFDNNTRIFTTWRLK